MDIDDILARCAALRVPRSSPLRSRVSRLVDQGALTRVLPGTYLRTCDASSPEALARARV
ncbi:hypothetical protein [Mariniluteicoccus flavus]